MTVGAEPSPAGTSCPICLTTATAEYGEGRDRLFGLIPGTFRFLRCDSCRSIFRHPMPRMEDLADCYPDTYWWVADARGESESKGLRRFLQETYREFVVRDHLKFLKRCAAARRLTGGSVIDVGCGSGTFLATASRAGFQVAGMDVSRTAAEAARRRYGLDVREGGIGSPIWGDRRFDFVTMFHVLEHLPEPDQALGYARQLLVPGGSIIVQVPNLDSLQATMFGAGWYGLDVPRHVINFTPKALRLLLQRSGFRTVRSASFSLRDNPASIASSLAPRLDPIGRRGRGEGSPRAGLLLDLVYLGLYSLALPLALAESLAGRGGTIWLEAVPQGKSTGSQD